jgi:twinkle protein
MHFRYVLPDNAEYTIDNILDSFKYLVSKYGIQGFVIDPWNTIEHLYGKDNETNYISKVLNKIKYFARANNTHAFVVAHPRKMMKKPNSEEYEVPNPYDISGSNNWYNIADNIITVYRHFKITDCNTSVYIQKVKHKFIGRVGKIDFNYDIDCQRYTEIDRVLNAAIKQDEEKDDIPF